MRITGLWLAVLLLSSNAALADDASRSLNKHCNNNIRYLMADRSFAFKPSSAILKMASLPLAEAIALIAVDCPNSQIVIVGHTDNRGDAKMNFALSAARAAALAEALVARGIRSERIQTKGAGSEQPIADNDTRDGRRKNRRLSIRFTEQV